MGKEIIFHCGLERTGTSFLQKQVFPNVSNVEFIFGKFYRQSEKIIRNSSYNKVLISFELGRNFEKEIEEFAGNYPDSRIILILRRPEEWIASQYRRYVKNGFAESFSSFYSLSEDGFFASDILYFSRNISFIQKRFTTPPLILDYETLKVDPRKFLDLLKTKTGIEFDPNLINTEARHVSYNDNSLTLLLSINRTINLKRRYSSKFPEKLFQLLSKSIRYTTLFIGRFIPATEPLIPKEDLKEIKEHFSKDWEQCLQHIDYK